MNPAFGTWEPGTRARPRGAHRSGLYAYHPATEHIHREYLTEEPIGTMRIPLPREVACCIELWRSVVFEAICDATRAVPAPMENASYRREIINNMMEAREWIRTPEFDEACEMALLNPAPLRHAIRKMGADALPALYPQKPHPQTLNRAQEKPRRRQRVMREKVWPWESVYIPAPPKQIMPSGWREGERLSMYRLRQLDLKRILEALRD